MSILPKPFSGITSYYSGENHWNQTGKDNPVWKGDKVSYHGLHSWINRNFQRPLACENCHKPDNQARKFEWASKTHNYTRNREDWLYLCPSCHSKFDILNNQRPDNYHQRP